MKIEILVSQMKEAFKNNQDFLMPIKGTSMQPFLKSNDVVNLHKSHFYQKNDVVFYLRGNGQYVLHRIYKIKKDYFVLMGDHQYHEEFPIYQQQILGKVTYVIKNGKKKYLKGFFYHLYLFFWRFKVIRYPFIKLGL